MSDDLRAAQVKLVDALLESRVLDGFDAKGMHATSKNLARKRKKNTHHERNHRRHDWLMRLRSWWVFP
jgi:hypothetical protein